MSLDGLRGVGNVARKELLQALRDRRMVFLLVVAPIIQLMLLGYAVNLDVDHIPAVICDQDRTEQSRALVADFFAGDTFVEQVVVDDPAAAQDALEDGEATIAIIIPPDYGRRLTRLEQPDVQIIVDATDAARSQIASQDATQLLMTRQLAGFTPPIVTRVLYNPSLETQIYMVPGILATLLIAVTTVVTAMGLAREQETGTLEQILVTPIRPSVLIGGKVLPYLFFGLIDVLAILVVGNLVFGVPMRGSVGVVGLGAGLYVLSTLGIGILIATLSSSQQQAMLGAVAFILPAMLLSGFITPIESMPEWLQPATLIIPMRHFIEIMRRCLLKGATLRDLAFPLASLAVIGTTIMAGAIALFRRQLS